MTYLDTYFSRVNHLGNTTSERIVNGGIRSFEKWMNESPHTIRNLSVERGLHFNGIILTDKDKSYQKIMYLNVANNIPIQVGDILNWTLNDGNLEKWILLQEEKKANPTYRTFWIVRCNYLLKWIDDNGHLQQSWAYVVSSVDSKIKGNYRTWNSLITPQPNKYAEILMPRRVINRATNFIIEEESWSVIEYDHTSVPGTIYLSLTENKINLIYDDVSNNIADTDKRAIYDIILPPEAQHFSVGETISLIYTITKNGQPFNATVSYDSSNKQVVKIINNELQAIGEGDADIYLHVKENEDIEAEPLKIHVIIDNVSTEFSCYIEGPSKIRLDREGIYHLISTDDTTINSISFSIDDISLATVEQQNDKMSCKIIANDKNKLGTIILTAVVNNNLFFTKEIKIVPLW